MGRHMADYKSLQLAVLKESFMYENVIFLWVVIWLTINLYGQNVKCQMSM